MRVLFVSPVAAVGGAERVLLDLLSELRKLPDLVARLCCLCDGPLLDAARALGVSAGVVPLPSGWARFGETALSRSELLASLKELTSGVTAAGGFAAAFLREVRDFAPDIVHSNGMKAHWVAALLAPPRLPLVIHVHDYLSERRISRHLVQLARLRGASIVTNSDSVASDAKRLARSLHVRRIHNGVDAERFRPGPGDRGWLAQQAGMAPPVEGEVTFALVATFASWKGQDLAIAAMAELGRLRPDLRCRLYIVGGPIYETRGSQFSEDELRRLARGAGIESRVGFVPFQRDTSRVYQSVEIALHASTRREAFGLSIAEAMASGKPVIVSRGGGALELFEEGKSAVGFTPGSARSLAEAMALLAADPGRWPALGAAARDKVCKDFDRARVGREFSDLYRELHGNDE